VLLLTAAAGLGAGFALRAAPSPTAGASQPPSAPDRDGKQRAAAEPGTARPDAPAPKEEKKPDDVEPPYIYLGGENAETMHHRLTERMATFSLKVQTSLDRVLDDLVGRQGIPWQVNEKAFAKRGDMVRQTVIDPFELNTVKRTTVLKRVLDKVPADSDDEAATFVIRGDHLEITPRKALRDEFYPGRNEPNPPPLAYAIFRDRPLQDALRMLADDTESNIVLDPRSAEQAKTKVTAGQAGVPLASAIRVLADMADLELVRIDNVYYATSRENAGRLRDKEDHRRPDKRKY
jgi:hypothetical protein